MTGAGPGLLAKVFIAALAIRWLYAGMLYAAMGDSGLIGPDSVKYLRVTQEFVSAVAAGTVHGWQWLGPDPVMMPLFTWLLTAHAALFGSLLPLTYVLMQGLFDAGTCIVVHRLAAAIDERYALPAAIAAAINPTQIVMSGMVYPDTPFVFFVACFLLAAVQWLRAPAWRSALLLGLALGAATLIRVLIAPWTAALVVLLFAAIVVRRLVSRAAIVQLATIAAIAGALTAPILTRNVAQYDAWALTPQGGLHLAGWVAPLVKEARDGTPWAKSFDAMEARKRERFGPPSDNPFVEARRYTEIGREDLAPLGIAAMAKAWLFGAAINLASPAVILIPPVMALPRTGFFGTAGGSFPEKVWNFLFRSENALYTWILLLGLAGVAMVRLIQLCGLAALVCTGGNWPVVGLFAAWLLYILAVNGPVASPKYRLPLEPMLAVLTGAGIATARQWRMRRRQSTA